MIDESFLKNQVKTSLVMLISRLARCFDERRTATSVELAVRESTGCSTRFFAPVKDDILKRIVQFPNQEKDVATFWFGGEKGEKGKWSINGRYVKVEGTLLGKEKVGCLAFYSMV